MNQHSELKTCFFFFFSDLNFLGQSYTIKMRPLRDLKSYPHVIRRVITCYPVIFFFSSGWNKASFYWPALGMVSACRLLVKIPTSPEANVSRLPPSWLQSTCRWGGCLSWQSGGKSCLWILLPRPHADKQHTHRQGTRQLYLGTQHVSWQNGREVLVSK